MFVDESAQEIEKKEIQCPCGSNIYIPYILEQNGETIQIMVKCVTCEKSGFIHKGDFVYQW